MLVLIKGAGDLATGVAVRLKRAGMDIVMTDLVKPSAIRRSVAFSEAMYHGTAKVESITAVLVPDAEAAKAVITQGNIPILADETGRTALTLCPDTMVDAIIAKRNTGTSISDAPVVIALGPGFTVGTDCHAAVETKRGHYMGRVYYEKGQSPIPNTGIPGIIAGRGAERVMHAPACGVFHCIHAIGDREGTGDGGYRRRQRSKSSNRRHPPWPAAGRLLRCRGHEVRRRRSPLRIRTLLLLFGQVLGHGRCSA